MSMIPSAFTSAAMLSMADGSVLPLSSIIKTSAVMSLISMIPSPFTSPMALLGVFAERIYWIPARASIFPAPNLYRLAPSVYWSWVEVFVMMFLIPLTSRVGCGGIRLLSGLTACNGNG